METQLVALVMVVMLPCPSDGGFTVANSTTPLIKQKTMKCLPGTFLYASPPLILSVSAFCPSKTGKVRAGLIKLVRFVLHYICIRICICVCIVLLHCNIMLINVSRVR